MEGDVLEESMKLNKKLLAVLGVAVLSGAAGVSGEPDGGERSKARFDRIKQELGLTDAQATELQRLRTEHKKEGLRRRGEMRALHVELRQLLGAARVDEQAVRAKAAQIDELRAAASRDRVDWLLARRRVLTAEQAQKLDALRQEHGGRRGHHGRWGMKHRGGDDRDGERSN
jgi:Spy/CpxP family protein refolding chaperone